MSGEGRSSRSVLVDGEALGAAHELDADDEGRGTLVQPWLYQLLRQPGSITDRTLEIAFLDTGVEANVFALGKPPRPGTGSDHCRQS